MSKIHCVKDMPEELIAMLFAKYSRSKESIDSTMMEAMGCSDPPKFLEKWAINFGHSSIAEHAIVHMAVEDVSILATKAIEDARLASFTERSTRFTDFGNSKVFSDFEEIPDTVKSKYLETCKMLDSTHTEIIKSINSYYPSNPIKKTYDTTRGLLPAGTLTNLGMTINARELAHLIRKLRTYDLGELTEISNSMLEEGNKIAPSLLKHVEPTDFQKLVQTSPTYVTTDPISNSTKATNSNNVSLGYIAPCSLETVLMFLLHDKGIHNAHDIVSSLSYNDAFSILLDLFSHFGPHDQFPRAFEAVPIIVEIVLDYGSYRDLQRHRLTTPSVQLLTCNNDYYIDYGGMPLHCYDLYRNTLNKAKETWEEMYKYSPMEAQYVVPLAYKVRMLWNLNLRELAHIIKLRTGPNAHPAYKEVISELRDRVSKALPWFGVLLSVSSEIASSRGV